MYFFAGVTLIVTQIALTGAENSTYHLADYPIIFELINNGKKLLTWTDADDHPEFHLLVENAEKLAENVIVEDLAKAFSTEDHTTIASIFKQIHLNFPKTLKNIAKRIAESFAGYSASLELIRSINKLILQPNFFNNKKSSQTFANILKISQKNLVKDLTKAFETGNYTAISDISSQIHVDSPGIFRDLIQRAIKRSFFKISQPPSIIEFFKCFHHHEHQLQSAQVYSAMIEECISRNKLKESLVVTLAVNFKTTYYKVCATSSNDTEDCKGLTDLFSAWPSFLSSLVTDKPICIKSKETEYYVYSIVDGTLRVRSVFKLPNMCLDNVKWILEPYKNALRIKSFDNGGYLSGGDKVYLVNSINDLNIFSTQWLIENHSKNDMYMREFFAKKYVYIGLHNPDTSELRNQRTVAEKIMSTYKKIPKWNITIKHNQTMENFQNQLYSVNTEISKLMKEINKHYLLLSENKIDKQSLWTIAPCNDVAC